MDRVFGLSIWVGFTGRFFGSHLQWNLRVDYTGCVYKSSLGSSLLN